MSDSHAAPTERAFAQPAGTFADVRLNRVLTSESEWVFARLAVRAHDLVLDLAAGTGLGSGALAPKVRAVVALDATPAMLEVGRAEAEREGLANTVFQRGDAAALAFLDGSFTIVVCRYAPLRRPRCRDGRDRAGASAVREARARRPRRRRARRPGRRAERDRAHS